MKVVIRYTDDGYIEVRVVSRKNFDEKLFKAIKRIVDEHARLLAPSQYKFEKIAEKLLDLGVEVRTIFWRKKPSIIVIHNEK